MPQWLTPPPGGATQHHQLDGPSSGTPPRRVSAETSRLGEVPDLSSWLMMITGLGAMGVVRPGRGFTPPARRERSDLGPSSS